MSFCVSLVIVIITCNKIIWLSGAESQSCWWAHSYSEVKGLTVPAAGCWVARSACSACRHLHFHFWLPGSWPVLLSTGEENQTSCERWWILFISQRMNYFKRSYYLWWRVCDVCGVCMLQLTCVAVRGQFWQRPHAGFWVLDLGLGMPSLSSLSPGGGLQKMHPVQSYDQQKYFQINPLPSWKYSKPSSQFWVLSY